MIIVSVEESALLLAMHEVVGGVEVKNQMLRRRGVGGDELIDENLGKTYQRLAIDTSLKPVSAQPPTRDSVQGWADVLDLLTRLGRWDTLGQGVPAMSSPRSSSPICAKTYGSVPCRNLF